MVVVGAGKADKFSNNAEVKQIQSELITKVVAVGKKS